MPVSDPTLPYSFTYLPGHHTLHITLHEGFIIREHGRPFILEVTNFLDTQLEPTTIICDVLLLRTTFNEIMWATGMILDRHRVLSHKMRGTTIIVLDKPYIKSGITIMSQAQRYRDQWHWVSAIEEAYRLAGIPLD